MAAELLEGEIREIDIKSVKINPHQPRQNFQDGELSELADSIKTIGLIHPPVVRMTPQGEYELIAGERRLRASLLAGYQKIPVLVRSCDAMQSAHAALAENIQRVDLNPLEVAQALRQMMVNARLTQEELSEKVGKKRSTVANYLRLFQLPPEIQEEVRQGAISMGHAKALLTLEGEKQKLLYLEIVKHNLSVRQAEEKAQGLSKKTEKKRPSQPRDLFIRDVQDKVQAKLGAKTAIIDRGYKGKICIDYYCLDDLNNLLTKLGIEMEP